MEPFDKNTYKLFDPILQDISRELTIKKCSVADHLEAFRQVFDEFRKKLMEAEPFLTLYKGIKYSGSYSNNIKIKAPDEFDMMLCMKLPSELNVQILNVTYPAYVQLKTGGLEALKNKQNWDKYKCIEKWLDNKNFIMQNKFREWMEGLIQKVLNQLQNVLICGTNQYNLKYTKANPAFTLRIQGITNTSIKFDLDLVPNFIFEFPTWPPVVKQKHAKKYKSQEWFVIAKPIYNDEDIRHRCWRIVLPLQESEILHSNNQMKSIIRFMKQLRDVHQIPFLKSYFINMMFIWEVDKQQSPDFWNNPLSYLFMYMLREIRTYVENEKIPYFWDNRLNLLEKPTQNQLNDCVIKIDNIFKNIKKNYPSNPLIIVKILGMDMENISSDFSRLSIDSTDGGSQYSAPASPPAKTNPAKTTTSAKTTPGQGQTKTIKLSCVPSSSNGAGQSSVSASLPDKTTPTTSAKTTPVKASEPSCISPPSSINSVGPSSASSSPPDKTTPTASVKTTPAKASPGQGQTQAIEPSYISPPSSSNGGGQSSASSSTPSQIYLGQDQTLALDPSYTNGLLVLGAAAALGLGVLMGVCKRRND